MSSSAPRQQPLAESSPFAYAEAGDPGGAPAVPLETGHGTDERNLQRAEIFEQGRQSGQQELRSGLDSQFVLERQSYYRRVEGEVVELALAIARKILHREVQIDPNTLAGIVRVTLEKLDTGTKVDLHVHPQEAAAWRHYFACETQDVEPPGIHEDPAIARGECRIDTSLGSTEIGLESQLKEIETGLLDLLAERPGAPPRPALAPATKPVPPNSLTNADTAGQT
jgi:flagellar assembly protein FliH